MSDVTSYTSFLAYIHVLKYVFFLFRNCRHCAILWFNADSFHMGVPCLFHILEREISYLVHAIQVT